MSTILSDDVSATRSARLDDTSTRPVQLIWPAILCAISLFLFALNIRHGIAVYVDSTRYMQLSDYHYDAPFYPWMLELVSATGLDLTQSATLIAGVILCLNVLLIHALLQRATRKTHYAVIGTALIIFSPQFVGWHSSAMSEPPFLTFLLLTLFAALAYLRTGDQSRIILAGGALGIATLVRFTAPPLGAALAVIFLLNRRLPMRRRLIDTALLAAVSGSIFLVWVMVSQLTEGRSIGRALWFFGTIGPSQWMSNLETVAAWILPDQVPLGVRLGIAGGILALCAVLTVGQSRKVIEVSSNARRDVEFLPLILGLFFVFYLMFVLLSTVIEANLSVTGRYGFPGYAIAVLQITCLLASLPDNGRAFGIVRGGFLGLAVIVLCSHAVRTSVRTLDAFRSGVGFTSVAWKVSPTIAATRHLPQQAVIVSNAPDAITYLTGRKALFSPSERLLRTDLPDPNAPLDAQLDRLAQRARRSPVYLVFLDGVDWRFYLATEATLRDRLPLKIQSELPDGRIYRVQSDSTGGR